MSVSFAAAQTADQPGGLSRGIGLDKDRVPSLSEPEAPDRRGPGLSGADLPVVPPPEEGAARLADEPQVWVRRFHIVGSTAFSAQELAEITAPFENRVLSSEALQDVRYQLTRLYVDNGYVNSGAVIPDQQLENGIVTIRIVEGNLSEIQVTGNRRLKSAYITERIAQSAGPPMNINRLQERLQRLQLNPLIRQINGELAPGAEPGRGELKVHIVEEKPYTADLAFNNARLPSVGDEQLWGSAAHFNVSGWGDALGVAYGLTEGLNDFSAYYFRPLNARNTAVRLFMETTDALVVQSPLDRLDIDADVLSYGLGVSHPLMQREGRELIVSLTAERRHSESFLLGEPFSFYPGVQNGESDVTVLRFAQDWVRQRPGSVFAVHSVLSWGLNALGATDNAEAPDGQFLAWLGQGQWARRLDGLRRSQLILRANVQLADRSLLPLEMFPLGGPWGVRGYRAFTMLRDNGVVASAELRVPVFRLPLPKLSRTRADGQVQVAPFADFGTGWNADLPTPDPWSVYSLGLGLRWDPAPWLHGEVYWGVPLKDIEGPEDSPADSRLYFNLGWKIF